MIITNINSAICFKKKIWLETCVSFITEKGAKKFEQDSQGLLNNVFFDKTMGNSRIGEILNFFRESEEYLQDSKEYLETKDNQVKWHSKRKNDAVLKQF